MILPVSPILSCDEARSLEAKLFAGDESKEWAAMQCAGRAIAAAITCDFDEIGGLPVHGRVLVLVGKGHNGGDALIAAQAILEKFSAATADVLFVFGERSLRPLVSRAWRDLMHAVGERVTTSTGTSAARLIRATEREFDLCLDGIFGFQFRPPADPQVSAIIEQVNALPIRFRAAIDLPSAQLFRADFTYATGSVKTPVLDSPEAGRIRYLDLGFFGAAETPVEVPDRALTAAILRPLAVLRPARCDKRTYGHVFVIGGSRHYPGAILMAVLAAIRSGVGLVTAFVPESLLPAFAARAPEAIWAGWPETPAGGLALEGEHLFLEQMERATAVIIGPGIGREPETLALVQNIVRTSSVPVVIDADAQQPAIVSAGTVPRIVTPHAGEFARIAGGADLRGFVAQTGATVVLKGPVTRVCGRAGVLPSAPGNDARGAAQPPIVYHSFFGGPVLARGGSGDVLAGLMGGLLAQRPADSLLAAARAVVWQGVAADLLARAHGQVAVHTTQLLDFLPAALRRAP